MASVTKVPRVPFKVHDLLMMILDLQEEQHHQAVFGQAERLLCRELVRGTLRERVGAPDCPFW